MFGKKGTMMTSSAVEDIIGNKMLELLGANNDTNSTNNVITASGGSVQNVTGNNMSVPRGCYVVQFEEMEFLPWDNPDNIVSTEFEDFARRLKDGVLLPILFLIGGPANLINMAVFYKQGLKERVNLCLFALSLADELFMVQAMFLVGEQMHRQFTTDERSGPLMRFMANNNLVGFVGFTWVSQLMSAIIASERCLCVLSPLRSQTMLQTRTMAAIVTAVYVVVVGLYFVVATRYRIACVFDPASNTVRYSGVAGEFYRNHLKLVNYLDSFVYGAGIPGVVIIVVTTTTIITAMKIRQAAAWRAGTSSSASGGSSSSSSISPREVALTKMLIGSSVLFIVCVSPIALFRFAWLFLPEMNIGRRHHNFFLTSLWILDAVSYINSTFNMFVYYTMGSRYRETFWTLFGRKRRGAGDNASVTKATNT